MQVLALLLLGMVSSHFQLELCSIFKSMSSVDCDSFLKAEMDHSLFQNGMSS